MEARYDTAAALARPHFSPCGGGQWACVGAGLSGFGVTWQNAWRSWRIQFEARERILGPRG